MLLPVGADVIGHNRVATVVAVLGFQAIKQALGRMALLARVLLILGQDLLDQLDKRPQPRPVRRLVACITRRYRKAHHFPDTLASNPKPASGRTLAHSFDKDGPAHRRIQFHGIHPFSDPETVAAVSPSQPNGGLLCDRNGSVLTTADWSIFAPKFRLSWVVADSSGGSVVQLLRLLNENTADLSAPTTDYGYQYALLPDGGLLAVQPVEGDIVVSRCDSANVRRNAGGPPVLHYGYFLAYKRPAGSAAWIGPEVISDTRKRVISAARFLVNAKGDAFLT